MQDYTYTRVWSWLIRSMGASSRELSIPRLVLMRDKNNYLLYNQRTRYLSAQDSAPDIESLHMTMDTVGD
jgi:hypothetical protein